MGDIFLKMLNMSMTAGWLVLAVLVVRLFLRKKAPKALFSVLWGLVAVRLICPVSFESRFSLVPELKSFGTEAFSEKEIFSEEETLSDLNRHSEKNPDLSLNQSLEQTTPNSADLPGQEDTVPGKTGVTVVIEPSQLTQNIVGMQNEERKSDVIPEPSVPNSQEQPTTDINKTENYNTETENKTNDIVSDKASVNDSENASDNSSDNAYNNKQSGVKVWKKMLPVVTALWLVGVIGMLSYMVYSYVRVSKRVKEAISYTGNVMLCDRIDSTFILGIIRPRIYMESGLSEQDRMYVLAHERTHLKRLDYLWKPLGFVLLSVYWFHPLLWVAYFFLCRDIEYACDESVIKNLELHEKKAYSNALISCSAPKRVLAACPLAFGENDVTRRVKSVLGYKKPKVFFVVLSIVLCVGLAGCFLTNPKAEDAENPTQEDEWEVVTTPKPEWEVTTTPKVDATTTPEQTTPEIEKDTSATTKALEDYEFFKTIENSKCQLYLCSSYALFLDENGKLSVLYGGSDMLQYIDFSKKYRAVANDPSCIIPIDEDGVPHPAYEYTAEEVEEQIRIGLKEAFENGGNYGLGHADPEIIRYFETISGAVQIFSKFPYHINTILFEDGTIQRYLLEEKSEEYLGAVELIERSNGFMLGRKADGTLIIPGIEDDVVLQKEYEDWTGSFRQICANAGYLAGVREDGTVFTERPALNALMEKDGWCNIAKIATGDRMIAGLKADGTVAVICENRLDEAKFDVKYWKNIVTIKTDGKVLLGVKDDGTVLVTGEVSNLPLITVGSADGSNAYQSFKTVLNIAGEKVSIPSQNVTINEELGVGIAFVSQGAAAGTTYYSIYRSEDGGASWFLVAEEFAKETSGIARILIPEKEFVVCYSSLGGASLQSDCVISEDGGRTWSKPAMAAKPNRPITEAKVGTSVLFGSLEQDGNSANGKEELEWIVVDQKDGKLLLLSKYILDTMPYVRNFDEIDIEESNNVLLSWENVFYSDKVFSEKQKSMIVKEGNMLASFLTAEETKNGHIKKTNTDLQEDVRITIPTAYAALDAEEEGAKVSSAWWHSPETITEEVITVRPMIWVDTAKLTEKLEIPERYDYEEVKAVFKEYMSHQKWLYPQYYSADRAGLYYELYRTTYSYADRLYIKTTISGQEICLLIEPEKFLYFKEDAKLHVIPQRNETFNRKIEENQLKLITTDTIMLEKATKPAYSAEGKEGIIDGVKESIKSIYEDLRKNGYEEGLTLDVVLSDFDMDKNLYPYLYLVINGSEVFETTLYNAQTFEVENMYVNGSGPFGRYEALNYHIDNSVDLGTRKGTAFDGRSIKPIDTINKEQWERVKECAVLEYTYPEAQ